MLRRARPPHPPAGPTAARAARTPSVTAFPVLVASALVAVLLAGCATTGPGTRVDGVGPVRVVAAENFWGSLAAQLGGEHAQVTSIIDRPDADPHEYEPTVADARAFASASLVLINGVGYDTWAARLVPAGNHAVLDVGKLVGVPAGGNPHRWYSPPDVRVVVDRITADLQAIDPPHASYYQGRHDAVLNSALRPYFELVEEIRASYRGTPVGASESIFVPLAAALGLDVRTPASFLAAISEGAEPTVADKATADRQIASAALKTYVYNSQNASPDVTAQVRAARARGIPVTTITETLTPEGASFQDWQVAQLRALRDALAQGTGR